jgi:hypothetical protein
MNTWPVFCAGGKSLPRHFFLRTTCAKSNLFPSNQSIETGQLHLPISKAKKGGPAQSKAWSIQNMAKIFLPETAPAEMCFMLGLIRWNLWMFIPLSLPF